jgi:hypothetical protein
MSLYQDKGNSIEPLFPVDDDDDDDDDNDLS